MKERQRVFSKAPWEAEIGYCRAIKAGSQVYVTGTAPIDENGKTYAPGDPYAQAKRCLELIAVALKELGLDMSCLVRTRMFVTDINYWREFGRAHGEFFHEHPPTTTMVEVKQLIDPQMLIEIEADGLIDF